MEIYRVSENQYKVIDGGQEEILTLDEVMYRLSRPIQPIEQFNFHEEFWRDE